MRLFSIILILTFLSLVQCTSVNEKITSDNIWPEITKESKPWTRWWWMGNAVNKQEIERPDQQVDKTDTNVQRSLSPVSRFS